MSHLDEELYQKHHDGRDGAQMQLFATNMHSWVSPEAIKGRVYPFRLNEFLIGH